MKKKPNGWNEMRLNHSIFQTEVQFNAPTKSNHIAGGPYETNHPTGNPPVGSTEIISKKPNSITVQQANKQLIPNRFGSTWGSTEYMWGVTGPEQNFANVESAKKAVESRDKYWLDRASGKVSSTRAKKWKKRYNKWKKWAGFKK